MNAKRLAVKYGSVNSKMMVLMHPNTDIAKLEAFFAEIDVGLALIVCKSLRGFSLKIGEGLKQETWFPELLFWLIACYNNPQFAKTYHLGWKFHGYERFSLAQRSQIGRRYRSEMIRFLDFYTLRTDTKFGGWDRRIPNSDRTFSFMGIEPSSWWQNSEDPVEHVIAWHGADGKFVARFPYPSMVNITLSSTSRQFPSLTVQYTLLTLYKRDNGVATTVHVLHTVEQIKAYIASNFHYKLSHHCV